MVMQLKTCCCGCSLRTGSVIIGILSAIGAVAWLVIAILGASVASGEAQKEASTFLHNVRPGDEEFQRNVNEFQNQSKQTKSTTGTVVFIIVAIISAVHLIISILLIFGASSEKPRLVRPWIIFSVIAAVVDIILEIVLVVGYFIAGFAIAGVLHLVGAAIGMCIFVYFILVVNSFYHELMSARIPNKI